MRLLPPTSIFSVFFAAAMAACSSSSSSEETIYKFSNDSLTVVAGMAVPQVPTVQIEDQDGFTVPGVAVVFTVTSGGGSVTNSTATTASDGTATPGSWILGTTAGVNTLAANAAGVSGGPITFTATGVVVAALVKQSGDNQNGRAGTTLINPVVVTVTDALGNPIGGALVTFSITAGGGSLSAGASQRQVVTDATGSATTTWNLGPIAGINTILVSVAGTNVAGNNATFTATGQ